MKTDAEGEMIWADTIGLIFPNDFVATPDGGYLIAGTTRSPDDNLYKAALTKLNENGNLLWEKFFSAYPGYSNLNNIISANGGGYLATGYEYDFSYEDSEIATYRIDEAGNLLWRNTLNGLNPGRRGHWIHENNDGSIYHSGAGRDEQWILFKTDSLGNLFRSGNRG